MMKKLFLLISVALLVMSCNSDTTNPQKIIDKAISASGGDKYLNSKIEFDFRDRHYVTTRNGGLFTNERITKD